MPIEELILHFGIELTMRCMNLGKLRNTYQYLLFDLTIQPMTRPISRIPSVLKIVAAAWIKNPDLRLGQLLENAWVNFYTEDLTDLVENFHEVYWTSPTLWWTYGINWDEPLHYLELADMDTSHIMAIVKTQTQISKELRDKFVNEVIRRSGT